MAIVGLPGWSESGGSWVPLRNGMKKLIWKEVRVNGGSNIKEKVTLVQYHFILRIHL
jgi:hypothetical protein